jgi:hypothetical protein
MDVGPTWLFQRICRYVGRQRKITRVADGGVTEEGTRCLKGRNEEKMENDERKADKGKERWKDRNAR